MCVPQPEQPVHAQIAWADAGRNFASSAFKASFDRQQQAPQFQDELFSAVRQLIQGYCTQHGIPEARGTNFFTALQNEAFQHPDELLGLGEVPYAAQRMWTSALKMTGVAREHQVSHDVCQRS